MNGIDSDLEALINERKAVQDNLVNKEKEFEMLMRTSPSRLQQRKAENQGKLIEDVNLRYKEKRGDFMNKTKDINAPDVPKVDLQTKN